MASLRSLLILLIRSLMFHIKHSLVQAQPIYINKICPNPSTYVPGSLFEKNLNNFLVQPLLTNRTDESSTIIFTNTTQGNFPDEVYGIFLCRGNLAAQKCQKCIETAQGAISKECPLSRNATIWYDECLIRYSDKNFASIKEDYPQVVTSGTSNVTDGNNIDQIQKNFSRTSDDLINQASFTTSSEMYASTVLNFTNFIKLSVMVQCIPDLEPVDCQFCLKNCLGTSFNKSGLTVLTPSCNIRYELYSTKTTGQHNDSAKGRKKTIISIVGSLSASSVVALFGISLCYLRRRKSKKNEKQNFQMFQLLHLTEEKPSDEFSGEAFLGETQTESQDLPLFGLDLIRTATYQFSEENKLGQGGFGPVYKGILEDGKEIAVKRLSKSSGQGLKEFMAEVTLIARLKHRNLVRLLGCCLEAKELLLVYEYMPNKSLDVFLFDSTRGAELDWKMRHGIIKGIARGMLYLHEDSRLKIIHRDLKSSNVLLDHEMNPRISDFGMARIFGSNQNEANTNRVVGTFGYMAPEYAMKGIFSVKSDVFSFGVLLLEIVSGKRNSRFHLTGNGNNLPTFAWKLWTDGKGLELMDMLLKDSYVENEVLKCIHVGLLCVQEDPALRPTMSSVVFMLGSDKMTLPQPTEPAFSVGRVIPSDQPQISQANNIGSSVNEVTLSNVIPR